MVQRQPLLRDEAQKKITEPGVRVPSVVEAQESVQRAQIDIVDDVAAPFDAELVVVRAFRPRDIPGELEDLRRLVLRAEEGAPYPREPGNLRVRQAAAVDRVLGYALDTYCALELMPNASCRESEEIRFQEPRNSLNADPPNTRDHPPTALCPLL